MGGVIISYSEVQILQRCGRVLYDNPFIHFNVAAKFLVFSPSIGGLLGEISALFAEKHFGCGNDIDEGSFACSSQLER